MGAEGSTNDGEIYRTSDFKRRVDGREMRFPSVLEGDPLQVPYHIVGDMGFSLSKTLFTVSNEIMSSCQLKDVLTKVNFLALPVYNK